MLKISVTWSIVLAFAFLQTVAAVDAEPDLLEDQLTNLRLLLQLSNREVEHFDLKTRTLAQADPVILSLGLGDGGRALIHEDTGVVYEFVPPTYDIREELKPEDIASRDKVVEAIAPIAKCYGLPADERYYDIGYSDGAGCFWTVQSDLPADLSGRPASLRFLLVADTLELRLLWYLPPIKLPPTPVRVSTVEARRIAETWLKYGSPFTPWDPEIRTDAETVKDVIRGRKYPRELSPAERILGNEIHLCWGIPFVFEDNGLNQYRVWVDVSTGKIVDTTPFGMVNR